MGCHPVVEEGSSDVREQREVVADDADSNTSYSALQGIEDDLSPVQNQREVVADGVGVEVGTEKSGCVPACSDEAPCGPDGCGWFCGWCAGPGHWCTPKPKPPPYANSTSV